jgi:hypothetical protein
MCTAGAVPDGSVRRTQIQVCLTQFHVCLTHIHVCLTLISPCLTQRPRAGAVSDGSVRGSARRGAAPLAAPACQQRAHRCSARQPREHGWSGGVSRRWRVHGRARARVCRASGTAWWKTVGRRFGQGHFASVPCATLQLSSRTRCAALHLDCKL